MKSDAELDAYLTDQLREPELADGGFTSLLVARMSRRRRTRQLAFGGAVALAGLIAFVLTSLSPETAPAPVTVTLPGIVASLLLASACALAWLATESALPDWAAVDRAGGRLRGGPISRV